MNRAATSPIHIRTFAALLCLFTLLLPAASCLFHTAPQQNPCDHCTSHSPLHQPVTKCCAVHPQPSAATASTQCEQFATTGTTADLRLSPPIAAASDPDPQSPPPPLAKPLFSLRI